MGDRRAAYAGFEGTVNTTMAGSEPAWEARPTPPEGSPNIIFVLVDDVGFSDLGCFGGEIRTPELDRLAAGGVRFTNFHVNPMCSPTWASLLTGVNAHATGIGHVAQDDPGFPGYRGELADNVATVAELLRDAGYATMMTGKWHLCRDADVSAHGPMRSWPCQRGFERFFGILDAFTNLHQPHRLIEDNHQVEVDRYPDGYYLTDELTTKSIALIRERKAARPRQPFFLYLAHPAAHAPLVAMPEDIARYDGVYDVGWDEIRRTRHQRQLELGVIPPGTPLPPRNDVPGTEVRAWDELAADEQRLSARHMAVYAAMIDRIDQNLGRLRRSLEEMGEWENTIVVFLSDNGASREGGEHGTTSYYTHLAELSGGDPDPSHLTADLARIDEIGSATAMSHYPRGWAMASNTPFRLYKTHTHAGGHQVPCIWSWPAGLDAQQAGTIRQQYGHCIDVLPTVLELAGLSQLTVDATRHGAPVKPVNGASLAGVLRDATHHEVRTEQYYEMAGNRGLYRDGWEVVTFHQPNTRFEDTEWELYDLTTDPVELDDLAAAEPGRRDELARRFDVVAHDNQVFPLDEGSRWRWVVRPPHDDAFGEPVTIWPGTPTLERWRSSRLIWQRSCTIRIELEVADGDRGVLVAHGDQGGGYVVYLDGGSVRLAYNSGQGEMHVIDGGPLAAGEIELRVEIEAQARWRWNVGLYAGAEQRGRLEDVPMLFPMAPFEGIDIGIDRRSPVSWELYEREGPFPFSGRLRCVTYEPGELTPDAGDRFVSLLKTLGSRYE